MNCEKIKELISLYMDDILPDDLAEQVDTHLQSCEDCSRDYKMQLEISEVLKSLPEIPAPDGFNASLHTALLQESKWIKEKTLIGYVSVKGNSMRKPQRFNWKQMSRIAAAFLFIITGTIMYQQGVFTNIADYIINISILKGVNDQEFGNASSADSLDGGANKSYDYSYGELQEEDAIAGDSDFYNQAVKDTETASVNNGKQAKTAEQNQSNTDQAEPVTRGEGSAAVSKLMLPDTSDENVTADESANKQKAEQKVKNLVNTLNEGDNAKTDASVNANAYSNHFDLGTLYYSLADYRKEDENTEIFVYNIGGTKNGSITSHQITIQVTNGVIELKDSFAE